MMEVIEYTETCNLSIDRVLIDYNLVAYVLSYDIKEYNQSNI